MVVSIEPEVPALLTHQQRNPLFAVRQPNLYNLSGRGPLGDAEPRVKAAVPPPAVP